MPSKNDKLNKLARLLRERSEDAQKVGRQWPTGSRGWVAADARAGAFSEAAAMVERERG